MIRHLRRGRQRAPRVGSDDTGAALILTICFVMMVGAIGGGLAGLASSSLVNRGTLETLRNREYAADAAIEDAITVARSVATSPLTACAAAATFSTATLNATDIRVDRVYDCGPLRAADGTVVAQRTVIFSACENTGAACAEDAVIIRARINFQQASTGAVTRTYIQAWSVNR